MRIIDIRTISGPNIYHGSKPVLVMKLDLEELTERESYQIAGFNDRLLDLLPGLYQHRCGRGRAGGFVERLHEGTWFGHIVEHVALELSTPAGISATFGKCRSAGERGVYNVIVEYRAEQGMRALLRTAVELVDALVADRPFPLAERIAEAREIVAETELGPSTRAIVDAATRRGIPWTRVQDSLVQLGHGRHRKFIQATISGQTSCIGVDIACDKQLTRTLLRQASIPAPYGVVVETIEEALAATKEIAPPVVVKPLDGRQGKGVSVNLTTEDEVSRAFETAREYSQRIIVEKFVRGRDYRVLVVRGTMVAAAERIPAHVVGDGRLSIAVLIEKANSDPQRGAGHEKPLTRIVVDATLTAHLERSGLGLDHVPAEGERVLLREAANLSKGGTAVDVTDDVHPSIASMCERTARIVGLDICGIDLVAPDITQPLARGEGGVVEVNAAPGIRMHLFPCSGKPRDVGGAIVDMLYPKGSNARIPIISITGTNGKTTVARLIGYLLSRLGLTIGMTTTGGIFIGEECVAEGDTTGPISARSVLSDPAVELAVLETARGGIMRSGLGYDWSDIGVFTNIQEDHIGQDGIENIADILYVKSLVAERVRDGGTLVINADNPPLLEMLELSRVVAELKTVVLYSLDPNNAAVRSHVAAGGTAYVLENGWLVEVYGGHRQRIAETTSIPITMRGHADFNVANCLAAVAACRAQGAPLEYMAESLAGFNASRHNPGRTSLYKVREGYVLVDYGHNPEAIRSIGAMAAHWTGKRITGVVGVPGDRADRVIEESGRVVARAFDRIIVREDNDRRGRGRREVALKLYRAIRKEAPEKECRIVIDEYEAVARAIDGIERDEIVVIFYEKLEPILEVLARYGAVPVNGIDAAELVPERPAPDEPRAGDRNRSLARRVR